MPEQKPSATVFPFVLFDWGDTLMVDNPSMKASMAYWPKVETVAGAADCLEAIKPGRILGLATGAEISTEAEIRLALARVNLSEWIDSIFCFKNTGLHKPDAEFYAHILQKLDARPEQVLMVGDNFEKDVAASLAVGMRAVWFNRRTTEDRNGPSFRTIHHLENLPLLLSCEWED